MEIMKTKGNMMNNSNIMLSIVMLTYNFKEYVSDAIKSIVEQKHNYSYELLISDDCSSDGTQDIIKQFQEKYPNIIKPVFNKNNLGAMNNFSSTFERIQGKYIMLCSGDDYWLPGKIQKQIDFLENNHSFDVCYSKAQMLLNNNLTENEIGEDYKNKTEIFENNFIPALTLCIRSDFFNKYLNEIKPFSMNWAMEDYPFNIYSLYTTNVFFMNERLAVYRVINGSVSHKNNLKKQYLFEENTYSIKKYFSQKYNQLIPDFDGFTTLKNIYNNLLLICDDKKSLYSDYNEICSKNNFSEIKEKKSVIKIVKQFLKCLLPYGFVVLFKRIKHVK